MFQELIKHEFKCSYIMPVIISCIIMAVGVLGGFATWLNSAIISGFVATLLTTGLVGICVVAIITIIKSMTGRLFNDYGYFTFSLPVSSDEIILSKLLINIIYVVLLLLSGFLSMVFFSTISSIKADFGSLGLTLFNTVVSTISESFKLCPLASIFKIVILFFELVESLLLFLFLSTICHVGMKKVLVVFTIIGSIFAESLLVQINIFPFIFYYAKRSSDSKWVYVLFPAKEDIYMSGRYIDSVEVLNPSTLIWLLGMGVGIYFLVRYLLKHKLEMR